MTFVSPPALAPGDVVAVVAPSSPFPDEELQRGLAWLRARYRVRLRPDAYERDGYLAGPDERRAKELSDAMEAEDVRAVVAARGGYGAMRLLDALPWEAFTRRPKWLIGFSDITALHVVAWSRGVRSVHGPNVTGLGREGAPGVREAWLRCVEGGASPVSWTELDVLRGGEAEGPLVGGNLSLLHAMAAAGRLTLPPRAILAIEDVTEAPYRVDRMLTSLRLGGVFARVAGVVLGGFDRCAPGADGRTVQDVLVDRLCDLGVPVVAGAPFGHGERNEAFVLGERVRIVDGGELAFAGAALRGART